MPLGADVKGHQQGAAVDVTGDVPDSQISPSEDTHAHDARNALTSELA